MLAMGKESVLQEPAPLLATPRVDLKAVESGFPVGTLTKFLSASWNAVLGNLRGGHFR